MPYVAPSTPANPQPLPINRYSARSSYFGVSGYAPSEGLKRARAPFRTKNVLTGALLVGFAGSIYSYSIRAVKQDDFSDLPNTGREGVSTIEEDMKDQVRSGAQGGVGAMMGMGSSPQGEGVSVVDRTRGVKGTGKEQNTLLMPQPTEVAAPLLPAISAADTNTADSNGMDPSAGSRTTSRFIVGAPDVDRPSRLTERTNESFISGRRVV